MSGWALCLSLLQVLVLSRRSHRKSSGLSQVGVLRFPGAPTPPALSHQHLSSWNPAPIHLDFTLRS